MDKKNAKNENNEEKPVFEIISNDFFSNKNIDQQDYAPHIRVLNNDNIDDSTNSLRRDISRRMLIQSQLSEKVKLEKKPNEKNKNKNKETHIMDASKINITGEFVINEFELTFLNLKIKKSSKEDVIKALEKISKINVDITENKFYYADKGITFIFDNDILSEMIFFLPFTYSTSKGIKLDDSIEKAIDIYGKPKMRTNSAAIWENIDLFTNENKITSIKIKA